MKYLILRKIRATSASRDELLADARKVFVRNKIPNLAEAVSYFSPHDPQEFFILYLFWTLSEPAEYEPIFENAFPGWEERRQVLQSEVYELVWEQRVLTTPPGASHFRLVITPASVSMKKAYKIINLARGVRESKTNYIGLTGTWIGRCISQNPTLTNEPTNKSDGTTNKFLIRTDWVSLEAQQNFFNSRRRKEFEQILVDHQIDTELASTDLRGITQLEQVSSN